MSLTHMSNLYKYLKKEHLNSLFENGQIKIGTLYDYNNENKYGIMVGDAKDGTKNLGGKLDGVFETEDIKKHPALSGIMAHKGPVTFSKCTLDVKVVSPNFFIYSTSYAYSKTQHQKWLKSEGYNTCFEIFDPSGFFSAISDEISTTCNFSGVTRVTYISGENAIDSNSSLAKLHPIQLKRGGEFGDQLESRAVWYSKGPITKIDISHKMVYIKNPERYCRPFAELPT